MGPGPGDAETPPGKSFKPRPSSRPVGARDKCGVLGVSIPGQGAAPYLYRGLRALQHRGQESAGIATSTQSQMYHHRGMGLVHEIFDPEVLEALRGSVGIGHVRYSTTGSSSPENAQPFVVGTGSREMALGHNGDIVNYLKLRRRLAQQGVEFLGNADSEALGEFIAHEFARSRDMEAAIRRAMTEAAGGYAVVLLHGSRLYAFRDPLGIRPLCLGTLDGGMAVSSESVALEMMGGRLVRDLRPGELVTIEKGQLLHSSQVPHPSRTAHCMFEWVYFSRPDSVLEGRLVYDVRYRIGRLLARESPVPADVVVPVPDSSRPQALGFSEQVGFPYAEGLIKNRFVERTFILPDQKRREDEVRVKLHPIRGVLENKRVVLLDDSIVRGTTLREIVAMVRGAGAREIHVRVGCPPIVAPCYYGVDMKQRKDLVACGRTEEQVAQALGADSVHYLTQAGLLEAIGLAATNLCLACLGERYPVPVPQEQHRFQKTLLEF